MNNSKLKILPTHENFNLYLTLKRVKIKEIKNFRSITLII
jgi:hypothetical protein